jgi:ribosomal protein S12 methylthiotransferase
VKRARYERVMATQAGVAAALARAQVGREVEVLIEREAERGVAVGRTASQAPEIDGTVRVRGPGSPGELVRARITGADVYDLRAEVLPTVDSTAATP